MQRIFWPVLVAIATFSLVACGSGKSSSSTATTTGASPVATAAVVKKTVKITKKTKVKGMTSTAGAAALAERGAKLFTADCSSCHQANGKGEPGVFPPLAGNALVTGAPDKVIHIVKNGLTGRVVVGAQTFNGMMPSWKATLSNADIAAVISYVRTAWGNKASAVSVSQVASTP